ncbi:hypothetical protein [Marinibacterium sp. SX1]|uniref:hypothetical protein n=1 Tax=Marinibacterium sp. SX1 TaxID=3388424 RepID=UPI003D17DDA1
MPRILTALATSAALTLTAMAAPARAQTIDPGAVVAGAVALGVIAAIANNSRKDSHAPAPSQAYKVKPVTRQPGHAYPTHPGQTHQWHKNGWKDGRHDHRAKAPVGRATLPAHCLRDVSRPGDTLTLYGQNCLSQARVSVKALPDVCAVRVPTQQGLYTGYAPSCLQARGYRAGWR